jgi:hypothetical protein
MKKNKEIEDFYLDFAEKIKLLLDESKDHYFEKSGQIQKNNSEIDKIFKGKSSLNSDEIELEELKKYNSLNSAQQDLYQGIWLSLNSNFIYCFALFETFQSNIIKESFRKNGIPKKRYIHRFKEFAINKQKQDQDDRYIHMLTEPKKMIEHYDDLPSPMSTCIYMFDLDTKNNKLYEKYHFNFVEAKERRNLLIHRGTYSDKRYADSFLQRFSNRKKRAKEFLEETLKKYSLKSKKAKKLGKIDLSVSLRYMEHVVVTLLYMASLIYSSTFDLSKKEIEHKDAEILPVKFIHDKLLLSLDKFPILSFFFIDFWLSYVRTTANNDWKKVPDIDKINYLLVSNFIFDLSKKDAPEEFYIHSKKVLKTITKQHKVLGEITLNHINNDVDGIIKNIKLTEFKRLEIDHWFVFKKFHKDKKFKEFVNTLKS